MADIDHRSSKRKRRPVLNFNDRQRGIGPASFDHLSQCLDAVEDSRRRARVYLDTLARHRKIVSFIGVLPRQIAGKRERLIGASCPIENDGRPRRHAIGRFSSQLNSGVLF
ncbi:MAG TPA: hypothetical protein VN670_09590 [Acidobacteriaceae bacterium]|nr:hypothetical protein [Acidobacteriaceae bacterium]